MDHKDWAFIETLYREKNLTAAAEKLYTSQPALTYRLRQLEKELGVEIAVRDRKGIRFTAQGEYLAKYASEMLVRLRQTKERLRNMEKTVQGVLRLGVSHTIAAYKLPGLLRAFLERYPEVEVKAATAWSSQLVHDVYKQEAHVGLIRGDYAWPDRKQLLFDDRICVVSSKELNLDELPDLPQIRYRTDASLRDQIDLWWQERYARPPKVGMELDTMDTSKRMAQQGIGYAIVPSIVLEDAANLNVYPLVRRDGQALARKSWMIYREESMDLALVNAFVAFAGEFFGSAEDRQLR